MLAGSPARAEGLPRHQGTLPHQAPASATPQGAQTPTAARSAPPAGADIPGSLFDPGLKGWSLRRLRSLLSDTLEAHSIRMPGVNEPYLYVGSWRSLFAW